MVKKNCFCKTALEACKTYIASVNISSRAGKGERGGFGRFRETKENATR